MKLVVGFRCGISLYPNRKEVVKIYAPFHSMTHPQQKNKTVSGWIPGRLDFTGTVLHVQYGRVFNAQVGRWLVPRPASDVRGCSDCDDVERKEQSLPLHGCTGLRYAVL